MKLLSTLSIGLMLLSSQANAVDIAGNYAVWGAGKKSCYGFKKSYEAEDIDNYKSYMKGFMTAYNIFTEKTYNISARMNEKEILEWLYAHCEDNPMSSFEAALTNFTFDHYDSRMKSSNSGTGR